MAVVVLLSVFAFFIGCRSAAERNRIASCPEYAFNEYLRAGIEFGIPGLLLSVAVIVLGTLFLYRHGSALTWGLAAWGIFAFASYPLDVWQLRVLLACFLGSAAGIWLNPGRLGKCLIVSSATILALCYAAWWWPEHVARKMAEERWHDEQRLADFGVSDGVSDSLALLYPQLRTEYRYLYDYGYALYKDGRYEESNKILQEGASISSDPMFYDIIGRNYEALGNYDSAERSWLHAHYMVPSRLYPYILLMEMEDQRKNYEKALYYAREILLMPVNERNMTMRKLHEKAEIYYEEYKKDN